VRKIIFLDIDGTLSGGSYVPASAKRACRAARKKGHLLYICSGRARAQISPGILKIGFDGVVSSGGAYVQTGGSYTRKHGGAEDGEKLLFSTAIEQDVLRRIVDYLNARKAAYMLEMPDKLLPGPYFDAFFEERSRKQPLGVSWLIERFMMRQIFKYLDPNDCALDRNDVCKLVFWDSGAVIFDDMAKEFGGVCELFRLSIPLRGMSGGEISPRGVHKGAALEKVLQYHGCAVTDSIAFGDSDNDRTMIAGAGLGIAMGNAADSLKAIADDVTDTARNNGIAKAFKKYGLV
jgi:Cof subfamily protein (haloacid dehalogenase superfamily)